MALAKKELERFFTSLNGSPRQRRVPLGVRIRVAHVSALYEPFHEEKVIFYQMRNKENSARGVELCHRTRKKKIKGRSVLTLYGSPEANRSISLGHPRLGFVAGNRRTGRGREKQGEGERSIWDNGGSDTCCFSNLKSPPACGTRGIITPSRDRHPAAGSRPDSWTVPPHGDFSFLPPRRDAQSCFTSCCVYFTRRSVSTSRRGFIRL